MQRQTWPHPKEIQGLGQKRTRAQKQRLAQEYSLLSKEIKKKCEKDKRNHTDQLAKYAEDAMRKNNLKSVYNVSRKLA